MAKIKATESQIQMIFRGTEEAVVRSSIEEKLRSGRRLRIKFGVDPSGSDLHLGHAVNFEKLRLFQEMGHQIVFIIGDFTARFGDPSDKMTVRVMKSKKETMAACKTYLKQIKDIIDLEQVEVRYNGEWYDNMAAEQLAQLMSRFTHSQIIHRDMFQRRIAENAEIGMHELIYPILQGYDSVMIENDIALAGSDQLFNEMQGRKLQELYGQKPQDIITMSILIGTDGNNKMGKSLGNYIALNDSPEDMFGKIMSIPDTLMAQYYRLLTRISDVEMQGIIEAIDARENMRELKFNLALHIVGNYHSEKKAKAAGEHFNSVFRDREKPDVAATDYEKIPVGIVEFVVGLGLATSKGEARRLVEQGGVTIDGAKIADTKTVITPYKGMMIQVGKRKFAKIK